MAPDFRTIGQVTAELVRKHRASRYKQFPRSAFGRRQLEAWVKTFGMDEAATRVNWDLDPIRWAMEHEIECARDVALGLRETTDIQAAE